MQSLALIAEGERVYPANLVARLLRGGAQSMVVMPGSQEQYNLTAREMDILHLLVAGEPNKVIARRPEHHGSNREGSSAQPSEEDQRCKPYPGSNLGPASWFRQQRVSGGCSAGLTGRLNTLQRQRRLRRRLHKVGRPPSV